MPVVADRGAGLVKKPQQIAIDITGHIEIAIRQRRQGDKRPELIILPVFDQDQPIGLRLVKLFAARRLVPELITAFATRTDLARTIDDISLAQTALNQRLTLHQKLPHLAIVNQRIGASRLHQYACQSMRVLGQIPAMFFLIGFGGGLGIGNHLLHPLREPSFKPDIDKKTRE